MKNSSLKRGIYQSASEWLFALFVAGGLWFLAWVWWQLWQFLVKQGGA